MLKLVLLCWSGNSRRRGIDPGTVGEGRERNINELFNV